MDKVGQFQIGHRLLGGIAPFQDRSEKSIHVDMMMVHRLKHRFSLRLGMWSFTVGPSPQFHGACVSRYAVPTVIELSLSTSGIGSTIHARGYPSTL
jgi:hypothetical protein